MKLIITCKTKEGRGIQRICFSKFQAHTVLFFIREAINPDKPYYTIQIKNYEIIQCRGKNNCDPNQAVKNFIEAFKNEKLNRNKPKRNMKKSA